MRHKYGAKKTVIDGITFMSRKEARRYTELKLMERAKVISHIELQPVLVIEVNGKHICKAILDFKYYLPEKQIWVWEDVKGFDTPISQLKRKLVEAIHGIRVNVL